MSFFFLFFSPKSKGRSSIEDTLSLWTQDCHNGCPKETLTQKSVVKRSCPLRRLYILGRVRASFS